MRRPRGAADAAHRHGDLRGREVGARAYREHAAVDRHAHVDGGMVAGTPGPCPSKHRPDPNLDVSGAVRADRDAHVEKAARADSLVQESLVSDTLARRCARGLCHRGRAGRERGGSDGERSDCSERCRRLSHGGGIGPKLEPCKRSCRASTLVRQSGRSVHSAWTNGRCCAPPNPAGDRYGAPARGASERITSATATTMTAPDSRVSAVIRSPRMIAPSATATTGFT
jgi:hypothetical protein